jgi:alkanesulfonate monooxygenase SsuD/methylene tetrahydromethanopterin reductase-like flavin-dependent oxidoreductase (luciferase family)
VFGLGAAWYEREHLGLGVPYPPTAERFERLEETLQICKQVWSPNNGRHDSKHYHLAETLCSPRPVQRPGPPILIGATGECKTLRLVVQYAHS